MANVVMGAAPAAAPAAVTAAVTSIVDPAIGLRAMSKPPASP